jgi:hypothetical protein
MTINNNHGDPTPGRLRYRPLYSREAAVHRSISGGLLKTTAVAKLSFKIE